MNSKSPLSGSHELACTPMIRGYMRTWFSELRERVANGEPYVLAGAMTPHEIFEAFDIPYVSNEWWSGQVAARRRSSHAFDLLERRGYHPGLPRYSALSLATALDTDNPNLAMGGLPKPWLVLYGSDDQVGRAEATAEAFGAEAMSGGIEPDPARVHHHWWDVSKWMWEDLYDTARIDCIQQSYRDIVIACERKTGRRFDPEKLREIMARVVEQEQAFADAQKAQWSAPKLPISMTEEMGNVMTIQWRRGTPWALEAAKTYRDEVLQRAGDGIAICPNEKLRISWNGVGLWQNVQFYRQFERSHGAVFARSIYASIAVDGYPRKGLGDPLRALASRYAGMSAELAIPPASTQWELEQINRAKADGVVMLPNVNRHRFAKLTLADAGVPVLELPVDAVDGRTWDEEKLNGMVAEWIETQVAPRAELRRAL